LKFWRTRRKRLLKSGRKAVFNVVCKTRGFRVLRDYLNKRGALENASTIIIDTFLVRVGWVVKENNGFKAGKDAKGNDEL
jgi:hypothetical protein